MNTEHTKIFQPSEVTEALRKEYEAFAVTHDDFKAILANTTTHILVNKLDAQQDGSDQV